MEHDDTGNVIGQRHPNGDIMVSAIATSSNRRHNFYQTKLFRHKQVFIQHLLEIIPG